MKFYNVITFDPQMKHKSLIQVNYLNVRKPFGFKFHRVSLSKCLFCLYRVQSYKSTFASGFKVNGRQLQSWFLLDMMWEGTMGGGQNQLLQKLLLFFSRAQRVFGAHQVFETAFHHMQNFWQKQILQISFCVFYNRIS